MDTLAIDRLHLALSASAVPERADILLARLRDLAATRLPEALARRLEQGAPGGYLFIGELAFDCPLNAAWPDDRLADALANALLVALAGGDRQQAARTFRDHAEFLAAFLLALADGSAWRDWCFDAFDGLRPLPASSALRTVLADEGEAGLAALARLTDEGLRRVLRCLSMADARRLLAHWIDTLPEGSAPPPDTLLRAARADATLSTAARHLASVATLRRGAAAGTLGRRALAWWETLCTAARAGRLNSMLARQAPADAVLAACCRALGIGTQPLQGWTAPAFALAITALHETAPTAAPAPARQAVFCRHGGAWLLLARLLRLGWWQRWQLVLRRAGVAGADGIAARLALAVIARALGAPGVPSDPAFAALAGGGARWPAALRQALGRLLGAHRPARLERALQRHGHRLLRAFAASVPGCDGASAAYLRRQCLALSATVACDARHIDVRLGRAPLDVLLQLAGLKRCTAALPDGRALVLLPEDAP